MAKEHLDCLEQINQAPFVVRTINLTQIAAAFKTEGNEESPIAGFAVFLLVFPYFESELGAYISKFLWKNNFWSPSYFADSCGGASIPSIKPDKAFLFLDPYLNKPLLVWILAVIEGLEPTQSIPVNKHF